MKHPPAEQWMTWLYGESVPSEKAHLEGHLRSCAECQAKVKVWRATATALDGWSLPEKQPSRRGWPAFKWAAAAAIVLALGFALGRFSSPAAAQIAALRQEMAQMARQIGTARADMQQEVAEIEAAYADKRDEENQAFSAALRQLNALWAAKFVALRGELETVAVLTENSLGQLAAYTQPTE